MRAIFGLVGLLMVVAIVIFWLNGPGGLSYTQTTIKAGQKGRIRLPRLAAGIRKHICPPVIRPCSSRKCSGESSTAFW